MAKRAENRPVDCQTSQSRETLSTREHVILCSVPQPTPVNTGQHQCTPANTRMAQNTRADSIPLWARLGPLEIIVGPPRSSWDPSRSPWDLWMGPGHRWRCVCVAGKLYYGPRGKAGEARHAGESHAETSLWIHVPVDRPVGSSWRYMVQQGWGGVGVTMAWHTDIGV